MNKVIGFDVYGTLVDPLEIGQHLQQLIGDKALEFAQLWHDKKVEYAFRRGLMHNAGVLPQLHDVISVDDLQTFKPNPAVYHYLINRTQTDPTHCWMVSSNPWDVIGAKAAGLNTAWIQRDSKKVFDPWGIEPDLTVSNLIELSEQLEAR
jgi:FMN phosphatase YigB (HAD superfamily)